MEASKSELQTSEILATLPAVQGQLPASLPPEVLAKVPAPQSQLPQSITPEMVASLATMQQQQPGGQPCNAGGGGGGLPADIPQLPKMPDFSGLADISFPPTPSSLFRTSFLHMMAEEDDDCTLLRYLIFEDHPNYELLFDDAEEMAMWLALQKEDL